MFTTNLRYLIGIAVFVSLLGIARGQGADPSSAKPEIPSQAVADWFSAASGSNFDGGMAENIDVFSTILAEDLHAFFGSSAKKLGVSGIASRSNAANRPMGTYLAGYGVTFMARTPAVSTKSSDSKKEKDKPKMTRWELTSQRMRGGSSSELATSCTSCHSTTNQYAGWFFSEHHTKVSSSGADHPRHTLAALTKQLIETLRTNGSNFRGLKPNERVAISVEYPNRVPSEYANDLDFYVANRFDDRPKDLLDESRQAGAKSPANNAVIAADLMMKQGRYENAIRAYQQVLETTPNDNSVRIRLVMALRRTGNLDAAERTIQRWLGDSIKDGGNVDTQTIRRLHMDLLGLPPSKDAMKELVEMKFKDMVNYLLAKSPAEHSQQSDFQKSHQLFGFYHNHPQLGPHPPRARVNRLTLSATKSRLDDVASGKISVIEFARQVERILLTTK